MSIETIRPTVNILLEFLLIKYYFGDSYSFRKNDNNKKCAKKIYIAFLHLLLMGTQENKDRGESYIKDLTAFGVI